METVDLGDYFNVTTLAQGYKSTHMCAMNQDDEAKCWGAAGFVVDLTFLIETNI